MAAIVSDIAYDRLDVIWELYCSMHNAVHFSDSES